MAAARAVVERHLEADRPVYGLTTGLGSRVTHRLPREALAEFSRLTILGRSNAVGPPMPPYNRQHRCRWTPRLRRVPEAAMPFRPTP